MTERDETSIIPCVEISYFDPFHLFEGLRNELEQRLPLINLHWKSKEGTLKTIPRLRVDFKASTGEKLVEEYVLKPFINCVIVSCESVEEYRSKIRPLIKNWLPLQDDVYCTNIAILHSNKEVMDSNMFKSISLIEKFNKDFPSLKTIETKTVYKSNEERDSFWSALINKLKQDLLEVFERRIQIYSLASKNETDPVKCVMLHENLLKIYLSFQLCDEASKEISSLESLLTDSKKFPVPLGELQSAVFNQDNFTVNTISTLLSKNELTFFRLHKCIVRAQLELFIISSESRDSAEKLNTAFHNFIWKLYSHYKHDEKWLQFKYSLYDEFIYLSLFDNIKSDFLKLMLCDLKNEQRECWIQLACSSMKYSIPLRDCYNPIVAEVDQELIESFRTKDLFYSNLLEKTTALLKEYSVYTSKRQRVMDWLSIDVALVYFDRGNYQECMTILQSSYDFYMESHWPVISTWLLEFYVECIKKSTDIEVIDVDGDLVPKSIVLSNSYLNLLTSKRDTAEHWWDEFLNCNTENNDNLVYPLDNIFLVDIPRRVSAVAPNKYGIDISFSKKSISKDINVSFAKLLMKNYSDEFLTFSSNDLTLTGDTSTYTLTSNNIVWCTFELVSLEIMVGTTVFKKEFDSFETEDSLKLEPCQFSGSFNIDVHKFVEKIGECSYLKLCFENPEEVDSFTLSITTSEDGVVFEGGQKHFVVKDLNVTRVPFSMLSTTSSKFTIKTLLSFTRDGEDFTESSLHEIDCSLPLAVTVNDIYLEKKLLFDFSLRVLANEPIILCAAELSSTSPDMFTITKGQSFSEQEVLNPCLNAPYQIYFQISKNSGKFSSSDSFNLSLKYLRLNQYLEVMLQTYLSNKLNDVDCESLWKSYILPFLKFDFKAFEMSRKLAVIKNESIMKTRMNQEKSFAKQDRHKSLLNELTSGISIDEIEINKRSLTESLEELVICVKPPEIEIFFSVTFSRVDPTVELEPGVSSVFRVSITSLHDDWETKDEQVKAVFTVNNNSEWAVGGKRRFEVDSKQITVDLNLIPLRRGYLNYPVVEIINLDGDSVGQIDYHDSNDKILIF